MPEHKLCLSAGHETASWRESGASRTAITSLLAAGETTLEIAEAFIETEA